MKSSASTLKFKPCVGKVSFYDDKLEGRLMANGQPYNSNKLTCASYAYPLGSVLEVSYEDNLNLIHTVKVAVTDRGPARRLGRLLDLSKRAFIQLSDTHVGVLSGVRVVKLK